MRTKVEILTPIEEAMAMIGLAPPQIRHPSTITVEKNTHIHISLSHD